MFSFLKVYSTYICLAAVSVGFVLKKDENFYLQVLLKECKYIEKEKKVLDTLVMP